MLTRHPNDRPFMCDIHKTRAVQIGSCLTCPNKAVICQTKELACSQRIHDIVDKTHRHILSQLQLLKTSLSQKNARRQIQKLFTQVYESIDHFKFDDIIFHEDDRRLIDMLLEQKYEEFSCMQVANIIPKLIKSTDYEDGHFIHLRNYLNAQKEKLPSFINFSILNMPQLRWKDQMENVFRFHQIAEESLKDINSQLVKLTIKPKRLRVNRCKMASIQDGNSVQQREQFVKMLALQNLKDLQAIQIYCTWDIDESEFQIGLFNDILRNPNIKQLSIYTSYLVTSTDYMEDLIDKYDREDIEVRVYKKDWTF